MSIVRRGHTLKRASLSLLMTLVIAGALYSGYLYFSTLRALVAQTSLPLPEKVVRAQTNPEPVVPVPAGQEQPVAVPEQKERVNILLLGIDQREGDTSTCRTDTMILVSLDPETNSASMVSIPRDLWVTIPGFGENRCNVAHYLGEKHDYPGGGPALAKKTIWYALGVPIHYYARINFVGFEKLVDAMGGITIDVEKAIHDEKYPDGHYGVITIDIPAGVQKMDGKTALQYARSRHGKTDFDRMERQQKVLLAARDKALKLDFPISRIPELLEVAGDSVKTDLSLNQIVALAEMAKGVDQANIRYGVIDNSMTMPVVTKEGAMVEVADWDKVLKLLDDLFPAPASSALPTPSLAKAQLVSEQAEIILQNGTLVTGLAQTTQERLQAQGFDVVRYGNADRFDHAETLIVSYTDKRYTVEALAAQLGVKAENVHKSADSSDVDIVVILGRDYAQRVAQE